MKPLSPNALATPHSGIREIVNRVVGRPDVLRLEIGQPSFDPPEHVLQAAAEAGHGSSGYTASAGTIELRELLVAKLERVNGIKATPEEVTVTVGAVGAISLALMAICSPGDEILIPSVAWPNYSMMATLLGLTVKTYECGAAVGYRPDLGHAHALVGPRTKALISNSPSNPAGVAFSHDDQMEVAAFADLHDLWVISDDTYDELIYEGRYHTPSTFTDDPRVISVFSFSKTYAMPGWRIGYVAAPAPVSEQIQKLMEPTVSCASSISQRAAVAALAGPQQVVAQMREAYRKRRDVALQVMSETGMAPYVPSGAFYLLVDIRATGMTSREFALRLLEEEGVAVAPGSAFGEAAEGFARVCFAPNEETIRQGLTRLLAFAGAHGVATAAGIN